MASTSILNRLSNELGVATILTSPRDLHFLYLTRFLRMFAYGSSALVLAIYLAALGHSDEKIGLFMTVTLIGDVLISLGLTLVADSLGRRNILLLGSVLMAISGVVFATSSNYWFLLLAAVVGVISPSGNEIGPFRAVEESTLADLSEAKTRSDIFAWYVVLGTLGTAGGSLAAGWQAQALMGRDWSEVSAYRSVFWAYAALGVVKSGLTLLLNERCEAKPSTEGVDANGASTKAKKPWAIAKISRKSRITLTKLCGLFFFDSLASGMVPMTLISFYIEDKFTMPTGQLGSIISAASFMSSIGNIFASSVSKRIGLVKTMVFTHLPSAIFLALIPAPQSISLTTVLLVARASLSSMDQAPRSAFLSAVVLPSERTAVMGIVNIVKTASQSSGPLIAGSLAGKGKFWVAFVLAGTLKASYDVGLLAMFVNTKTTEETVEYSAVSENMDDDTDDEGHELDGRRSSEDGIK